MADPVITSRVDVESGFSRTSGVKRWIDDVELPKDVRVRRNGLSIRGMFDRGAGATEFQRNAVRGDAADWSLANRDEPGPRRLACGRGGRGH